MKIATSLLLIIFFSYPSLASIQVRFDEGAPKDRFTIENAGNCDLGSTVISIDLSGSPHGLVFDVTGKGAGVEVFQPFELVNGGEKLRRLPIVKDGDDQVTLEFSGFKAGETLSFTIDVDDTMNAQQITVSNSEIAGATIIATTGQKTLNAPFHDNAEAVVAFDDCGA